MLVNLLFYRLYIWLSGWCPILLSQKIELNVNWIGFRWQIIGIFLLKSEKLCIKMDNFLHFENWKHSKKNCLSVRRKFRPLRPPSHLPTSLSLFLFMESIYTKEDQMQRKQHHRSYWVIEISNLRPTGCSLNVVISLLACYIWSGESLYFRHETTSIDCNVRPSVHPSSTTQLARWGFIVSRSTCLSSPLRQENWSGLIICYGFNLAIKLFISY